MKTNTTTIRAALVLSAAFLTSTLGAQTLSSKPWLASAPARVASTAQNQTLAAATSKPWIAPATPSQPMFEVAVVRAPTESTVSSKAWINAQPGKTLGEKPAAPVFEIAPVK